MHVQACGDAHVNNFGFFASPERNLVFDINDFDETIPGPWEWDVKRLCASLHVVARQRGCGRADADDIVMAAARAYRTRIADYATWRHAGPVLRADRDQRASSSTSRCGSAPGSCAKSIGQAARTISGPSPN